MNKKVLLNTLLCIIPLSLTSCGSNNQGSEQASNSVSEVNEGSQSVSESAIDSESLSAYEEEIITNDNYYYVFKENAAIADTYNFSVSSSVETDLSLRIDDQEVKPLDDIDWNMSIKYETLGCNSNTANNASDYIYLNGKKIGKLPSDGSKGISFSIDQLNFGDNVVTITIGGFWGAAEYDYTAGNSRGNCDDFKIGKMKLITNTLQEIPAYKMVEYKNVKNSVKYNTYESVPDPDTLYAIGDGWDGNLAYDGNPKENLNVAQKLEFHFMYDLPASMNSYSLNTKEYSEGIHKISLYDNDEVVLQNHIYFDNSKPEIKCNVNKNALLSTYYTIKYDIYDDVTEITDKKITLDTTLIESDEIKLTNLQSGVHSIIFYAKDKAGNEIYEAKEFSIIQFTNYIDINTNMENDAISYSIDNSNGINSTVSLYSINALESSSLTNKVETSSAIPAIDYTINVTDTSKPVYVTYTGKASSSTDQIALLAFNQKTQKYDEVGKNYSEKEICAEFNPTDYVKDGKISLQAKVMCQNNGSNKILWASDTQYLPRADFTDINKYYTDLMNYVSKEYKDGNAAYFAHTGDIVDSTPSMGDVAVQEWIKADAAFKILDDNNVPYGVSAGNHDVGTEIDCLNYCNYDEFFNSSRFNGNNCYGGSYLNNRCHYDLITVGQYDFVVIYLGYGIEVVDETLSWVDMVLNKYSTRNAIIATHSYLNASGQHETSTQGQQIYEKIITKYNNIKFVFSGHDDGSYAIYNNDNGHDFYEILNCYQFVEKDKYAVNHVINGYDCNGEGYMKSLEFNDGEVVITTYSPIKNIVGDPYSGAAVVTGKINLIKAEHSLETVSFSSCQINEQINSSLQTNEGMFNSNLNSYLLYVSEANGTNCFTIK